MELTVSSSAIVMTSAGVSLSVKPSDIYSASYDAGVSISLYSYLNDAERTMPDVILYAQITAYNGGAVPSFATIQTDIEAARVVAATATVSGTVSAKVTDAAGTDQAKVAAGDDIIGTDLALAVADANAIGHLANIASDIGTIENTVGDVVQTPAQTQAVRVQIGPGDIISYLPVIIDYDHHQLHEGEVFRWSVYVSSLASTNNKDIRLVVPNISMGGANPVTKCPHFRFEIIADGYAQGFLYEAPTVTGNGTQRTPIAMERNGTYTSKLEIHEDPTITGVGTLLWQGLLLGSKNSAGDTTNSIMEFVLKNNTTYLFRVTSGTAGLKVLIRFMWYEDLGV